MFLQKPDRIEVTPSAHKGHWLVKRMYGTRRRPVVTRNAPGLDRAIQVGAMTADYYGVPLIVDGQEWEYQGSRNLRPSGSTLAVYA